MEAATNYNEASNSTTHVGGYRRLPQEDPEITLTPEPTYRVPQQPTMMQSLPPSAPEPQTSQYTPVPQSFNSQQQSSSVSMYAKIHHFQGVINTPCGTTMVLFVGLGIERAIHGYRTYASVICTLSTEKAVCMTISTVLSAIRVC